VSDGCFGNPGKQGGGGLLVRKTNRRLLRSRQPLLLLRANMLELLLQSMLQPSLLLQSVLVLLQ
jgi:hypothetical protein